MKIDTHPNGFLAWLANSNRASEASARFHWLLRALISDATSTTQFASSQIKPMPKNHFTLRGVVFNEGGPTHQNRTVEIRFKQYYGMRLRRNRVLLLH